MPIIDTVINRKANIVNVIFFIVLNLKNPAVVRFFAQANFRLGNC